MTSPVETEPKWHSYSHHDRFRKLQIVRRRGCRYRQDGAGDVPNRIVYLDGAWINDIPSFHLALGEAVNGPNSYFGGELYALRDCLNGGFGVLSPLTIRLSHFDDVRKALNGRAWCRFRAEHFQEAVANDESDEQLTDWGLLGDGSPADIDRWTAIYKAALAGKPFDSTGFGSYFDAILETLESGKSVLIPADTGQNKQASYFNRS